MKSDSPHILVVGSSNTDLVLSCDKLPQPGETLQGGALKTYGGGKGANQAVAAARAGAKVHFVGAYGSDSYGEQAVEALQAEGIALDYFSCKPDTNSGVAMILLGGEERQNMIVVAQSANHKLSPQDVNAAEADLRQSQAVLASLEVPVPAVLTAAELAGKHGIPFILNPAPAQDLPPVLLKLTHTLIPNEHEAESLTGEHDIPAAAEALHRQGCRQVVITLGSEGVYLSSGSLKKYVPAPKVNPVDTVGAGDCFCAWLTVGIASGLDLETAAERAVKAASIAVTRHGAQSGMPHAHGVIMLKDDKRD